MINVIFASDLGWCIGDKEKLPWHLSEDLKRFRQLTSGHVVIMGRKTWDSLSCNPLANRQNLVITRSPFPQKEFVKGDASYKPFYNLIDAIEYSKQTWPDKEIFIIGGAQIFEYAFNNNLVDRIYWTLIWDYFKGDTFINPIDLDQWETIEDLGHILAGHHKYFYNFYTLVPKGVHNGLSSTSTPNLTSTTTNK